MSDKSNLCPNLCPDSKGAPVTPITNGEIFDAKVPEKGVRPHFLGPKTPEYIVKNRSLTSSSKYKGRGKPIDEDLAKYDKDTVMEEYHSDEVKMCLDSKRKNDDTREEEVMKSCMNLEIDG